ncbi:branched-chain amino acid ABC transporter substrate-binding protein [Terasakiella sp. A23]|uniref:branched-chain amino acid ABC transporter substrate-binding protein n=1 Tax=Terasakiella sp. FCG-A23 TaxID=3080561 RepID=UPI002953205C|nr:branched-chain amino acid ABC transporter substrate-binding protein [Terasakiella sp. A23]MDV7338660.1 branched-chain amino acid ABC transporter substrate-binding protein [Terasakiella sp. A23]
MTKTFKTSLFAAAAAMVLSANVAQADIKIGVAGPFTGQLASFGEQLKRGAEMAVEHLNAKGGVNGEKIELLYGDDQCDPKQAVSVANNLVNQGVQFVAGHFCSSSSIPASDVYHEEGIPMITPASTNPTLTEKGYDRVYRVCGRDDQQGSVAGAFVAKNYADTNVAIIHDKTAYGKGLADEMKKALNAAGKKEAMYEPITAGEKDYSALISKLKKEKVSVVYLGGYHPEGGLIVRQAKEQGLNLQLISGDALNSLEFGSIAGQAGDGTLFTFGPEPRNFPEAKAVVDAFAETGYDPEGYTLYTYATIQAWAQAATEVKTADVDKVAKQLHNTRFKTVIGEFSFDEKGDTDGRAYVWYEWNEGNYAEK